MSLRGGKRKHRKKKPITLLDLLLNRGRGLEEVNLGVQLGGAHFAAAEAGDHRIHEVNPLLVAKIRQVLLGQDEDLALVDTTKLHVHPEVLLVKGLEAGVEKPGEEGRLDLLDHLGTGLLGIVLRHLGGEPVDVQGVLAAELVVSAPHELELVQGHANGLEERLDDGLVVLCPQLEELPGGLHVVKVGVEVGKENGNLAAGHEEVGHLGHGHEVANVGLASRGRAPVDLDVALLEELLELVLSQHLLQVPGDQLVLLLRSQPNVNPGHREGEISNRNKRNRKKKLTFLQDGMT